MRRILFPLVLGVSGVVVLCWLGFWQLDRLAWKETVLADINTRLTADPSPLPETPEEAADEYANVVVNGALVGPELHVLASGTEAGTGYRVIRKLEEQGGRRVMIDLGLLPLDDKTPPQDAPLGAITGTLLWPDDVNSSTPAPDMSKNIWFGRDVQAMAKTLGTEPVMVIAREMSQPDPRTTLLPVDTAGIKNDHLSYAITWFGLALVWAIMTLFLIFRTLRSKDT
ncbi:MAG: SURF1 family protein [Yoonia sp.]|nr:SURF1 family protein [Yoonia sp.]MDG1862002.1 SURF1 family protein [Yoonia sp.]